MTDTARLAALLCEVFPAANRNQWPFTAMDVAAFLVAAGVTAALDVDHVEEALRSVYASHYREYYSKDPHDDAEDFVATYAALEATDV